MVLQWAVMNDLDGIEYAMARHEWSVYSLYEDGSDVGPTDVFLRSKTWRDLTVRALDEGLVVRRHRRIVPVWGTGPSPAWWAWCHERRSLGPAAFRR